MIILMIILIILVTKYTFFYEFAELLGIFVDSIQHTDEHVSKIGSPIVGSWI